MTKNKTSGEIFEKYNRKFLNENRRQLIDEVDEIVNELWRLRMRIFHSNKDTRFKLDDFIETLDDTSSKCWKLSICWILRKMDYKKEKNPEIRDELKQLFQQSISSTDKDFIETNENNQSKLKLFD